jgi:BlaI family transcriptional regulator, penicillinase repressor
MPRPRGRPTDLELEILKALWEHGPATVRTVLETIAPHRRVGYTTVLKMLQIMEEKELVRCDRSERAHLYQARESRGATLRTLAGDLLERAFDGSMQQLVLHALDRRHTSAAEVAELRSLLDEIEGRYSREPNRTPDR